MRKKIGILALGGLLAFPAQGLAEDEQAPQRAVMDEVVVTASRTAQSVDETLAAVTVITRQDLERGQFRSLPEALSSVPGLQVTRSGGMGQLADVFMRGTETNHTLVLVDGIRIGSATNGRASLQHIPVSQIERIEVVRGPRSTLYGADAVGGVIHIFTRKGSEERRGSVSIGGGSHGTYEGRAALAGGKGGSHYSITVGHLGSRGIDVRPNNVPDPGGWGNTPDEPDKDGYRETSLGVRLGHRFSPGNELEIQGLHAAGTTEFDGDFQNETDFLQQVAGLTLRLLPVNFWNVTLQGGQSRDEGKNLKDGAFSSRFDTRRTQFGWQNDFFLNDRNTSTLGVDYYKDRVDSSTAFDRGSRDNTGIYAQHQLNYGPHGLILGLRHDDNEQFGSHTTYNAGYGLQLPRALRLSLNYGTAFRAPTFNELYWPNAGWGGGNPDLNPEESRSYEAALQQRYGSGHWRLGIFRTDIDNLISGWPAVNVNRARIDGLELESGHQLVEHWQLSAAVTFLNPRDRDSDLRLPRRAKRTASISLDADYGQLRSGLTLRAFSTRFDDRANKVRLPGYAVVDWRAEYDLSSQWLLQAKVENLLDKDYEEAATFNTPGRSAFATLSYNF
jgi:vitamin B12 transporter